MYQPRTYRQQMQPPDLVSCRVCVAETDLQISARCDLSATAYEAVRQARQEVEDEIALDRRFLTSLEPRPLPPTATPLVGSMYAAAEATGVGPMAAVAGAVAQYVAFALLPESRDVIVENGGDIYLASERARTVAVFAGNSPLSNRFGLLIPAHSRLGICTSSGTVGHSLSFGKADAALTIADDAALADAAATGLGNRVQTADDVQGALDWAQTIPGIRQALVVIGETMGVWGEFELTPL